MRPQPRAAMRGPSARASRNGPFTLVSMTVSQSASLSDSLAPRMFTPALFTRMSSGPSERSTLSTSRSMSAEAVTSAWNASTRRPVDGRHLGRCLARAVERATRDGDVGAGLGERLGHDAAEPARAAR